MMVAAIDQRNADVGPSQRARSFETAKAATKDNDMSHRQRCCRRKRPGPAEVSEKGAGRSASQ
jgi:hypothetical protein